MEDKKKLLLEIKELWKSQNIEDFDIAPELLEYLEVEELEALKRRVLKSLTNLTSEQKEWLEKFKSY